MEADAAGEGRPRVSETESPARGFRCRTLARRQLPLRRFLQRTSSLESKPLSIHPWLLNAGDAGWHEVEKPMEPLGTLSGCACDIAKPITTRSDRPNAKLAHLRTMDRSYTHPRGATHQKPILVSVRLHVNLANFRPADNPPRNVGEDIRVSGVTRPSAWGMLQLALAALDQGQSSGVAAKPALTGFSSI